QNVSPADLPGPPADESCSSPSNETRPCRALYCSAFPASANKLLSQSPAQFHSARAGESRLPAYLLPPPSALASPFAPRETDPENRATTAESPSSVFSSHRAS